MRYYVTIVCLLSFALTGCNPADLVRKMREADRQSQSENYERQLKKAMESYESGAGKDGVEPRQ